VESSVGMHCLPLGLALHCRYLLRQVSLLKVSIADGNSVGASVTNTLYVSRRLLS
jgi:hypothetical protein